MGGSGREGKGEGGEGEGRGGKLTTATAFDDQALQEPDVVRGRLQQHRVGVMS